MENGKALREKKPPEEMDDGFEYPNYLNEPFLCFICLELVHKPVVNACGHMFCFWCVHHAMNAGTESYCPLCRRPYIHFPRICEQLHFLLLKAVPDAYRRRCKEVYEEEAATCVFSPQFDDGLQFDVGRENSAAVLAGSVPMVPYPVSTELMVAGHIEEDKVSSVDIQDSHVLTCKPLDSSSSSSCLETNSDVNSRQAARGDNHVSDGEMSCSTPYVTATDLLCKSCNKLLCRPVVMNCGHVFCEACVIGVDDGGDTILKCFTCGSVHPGAFPHLCLELHQYLEQNFSSDYEKRKIESLAKPSELQKDRNNLGQDLQPCDVSTKIKKLTPQPHPRMHHRIGCDGCGMYPMLGRRFKCIDCPKIPGYDLCLHCYENETNLAGRFNQQHTNEHRMREILGSASLFDDEFQDGGEGSEGLETYFGIVGYFA